MAITQQNSKQYFRSINIIFFALLIGQLLFAIVALVLNSGKTAQPTETIKPFLYLAPILVVNGFVTGNIVYRYRINKLKTKESLIEKMVEYTSVMIIRLALLESASLFAIVVYLLTANIIFIGMSGLVILYFITLKPTLNKVALDLELNTNERLKVEDPNEIIAEFEKK